MTASLSATYGQGRYIIDSLKLTDKGNKKKGKSMFFSHYMISSFFLVHNDEITHHTTSDVICEFIK